jgi:hypothetical protein
VCKSARAPRTVTAPGDQQAINPISSSLEARRWEEFMTCRSIYECGENGRKVYVGLLYDSFNDAVNNLVYAAAIGRIVSDNELERMSKKAVVA